MDLTKLSDEDLLALHKGDLRSVSDAGLAMLAGGQPIAKMSDENPLTQAFRGFSQRGKEAAVGLAELTGLVPESVSQNVKAEREWVRQRPMAQIGSIAADIAMTAPAALANPAMAATLSGGGALGGVYGYATQPGNLNQRILEGSKGMAGGLAGAAIGKALPYAATVANRMTAPFREEGRQQILSRLLKSTVGPNAESIAARMSESLPYVQGSLPTAAEAAQSGGISALQRWAEQANPEQYAFRRAQNMSARKKALSGIAGDDLMMDTAKGIRASETSPLYEAAKQQFVPVDEELRGLLKRPSMSKALGYAEEIAAEQGKPISQAMKEQIMAGDETGQISGEALHWLKIGLDAMRNDPKNPMSGAQQNALKSTISKFEDWRAANLPVYAEAQAKYSELSRPISQMQIGQELSKKLTPALAENTALSRETANAFAQALREADLTARKATGFKGATFENTMTPEQIETLKRIQLDLARKASADELGRGIGSNTFQNIAMQDLAQVAGYPGALIARGVNRIPLIGELVTDLAKSGVKGQEELMRNELSDVLLDPKRAAELLRLPESTLSKFFKNKQYGTAPAVIGSALANNMGD